MLVFKCHLLATAHSQAISELPLLPVWQPPLTGSNPAGFPTDTGSCHSRHRHDLNTTCCITLQAWVDKNQPSHLTTYLYGPDSFSLLNSPVQKHMENIFFPDSQGVQKPPETVTNYQHAQANT